MDIIENIRMIIRVLGAIGRPGYFSPLIKSILGLFGC